MNNNTKPFKWQCYKTYPVSDYTPDHDTVCRLLFMAKSLYAIGFCDNLKQLLHIVLPFFHVEHIEILTIITSVNYVQQQQEIKGSNGPGNFLCSPQGVTCSTQFQGCSSISSICILHLQQHHMSLSLGKWKSLLLQLLQSTGRSYRPVRAASVASLLQVDCSCR